MIIAFAFAHKRGEATRWSENGHPRARVRQRRASVGYGQPVRESVCGWHEGHQGEFKDGGEMESRGLYSRARGQNSTASRKRKMAGALAVREKVADISSR